MAVEVEEVGWAARGGGEGGRGEGRARSPRIHNWESIHWEMCIFKELTRADEASEVEGDMVESRRGPEEKDGGVGAALLSDGKAASLAFPSAHPPTLMIPPAPHDSHPLPGRNYSRRSAPSESSITLPPPSLIIKQVYELRPAPDCIQEHQLSSFYESERASERTSARTRTIRRR